MRRMRTERVNDLRGPQESAGEIERWFTFVWLGSAFVGKDEPAHNSEKGSYWRQDSEYVSLQRQAGQVL
jgi:hypothetical protein